ncbi:exodeoxyribonuclease VII large subunit [Verrucomicrobiota bacterium]
MTKVISKDSDRKVYTVVELTRLIKAALEEKIGKVWVEGELSNVIRPSSGHYYFTIKDASSELKAVLFRGSQRQLNFQPKDGVLVRVLGEVSVYEKRGNYQIIVRQMEEAGKGSLQAQFEALKEKLQKEGLFDTARKKAIPLLPRHIGVVTSPTGAAIRDILNVVSRRFPNLHIVLAPVKVQGEGAGEEIASAIDLLNERGGIDVMIVGRGGGSLEDLWCFNGEVVARAIARSGVPVISAVGHEIDFTISDFTADMRAATPSAAAELVVEKKNAFDETLVETSRRLVRALNEGVRMARNRMVTAGKSYVFREPQHMVNRYIQQLDNCKMRIYHQLLDKTRETRQGLDDYSLRLVHEIKIWRQSCLQNLKRLNLQIRALNPVSVLGRGYSITRDREGRIIRTVGDVCAGQRIHTQVAKGEIESEVVSGNDE